MKFIVGILVLLSIFCEIRCRKKRALQCSIDIRTDLIRTPTGSIKEPLIVKYSGSEYKLMIPDDGILKFNVGESALVACTSDQKQNFLTYSKFHLRIKVTCDVIQLFICFVDNFFIFLKYFRQQTKLDNNLYSWC
jgi:hypothetical protein